MKYLMLTLVASVSVLTACTNHYDTAGVDSVFQPGHEVIDLTPTTSRINYTAFANNADATEIAQIVVVEAAKLAKSKGFNAFYILDADKVIEVTESVEHESVPINREIPPDLQCTMSGCDPVAQPQSIPTTDEYYSQTGERNLIHYSVVARFGTVAELQTTDVDFLIVDQVLGERLATSISDSEE